MLSYICYYKKYIWFVIIKKKQTIYDDEYIKILNGLFKLGLILNFVI